MSDVVPSGLSVGVFGDDWLVLDVDAAVLIALSGTTFPPNLNVVDVDASSMVGVHWKWLYSDRWTHNLKLHYGWRRHFRVLCGR